MNYFKKVFQEIIEINSYPILTANRDTFLSSCLRVECKSKCSFRVDATPFFFHPAPLSAAPPTPAPL